MSSTEFLKQLITEELYILPDLQETATTATNIHNDQHESSPSTTSFVTDKVETAPVPLLVIVKITNSAERELLEKVISSVGLQMDQVTLIEPDTKHNYKSIKTILFSDDITDFYIVKSNEIAGEILNSRSLSTLSKSVEDKKSLWVALKSWFEV